MRIFWRFECVWLVVFQLVAGTLGVDGWWQESPVLVTESEIGVRETGTIGAEAVDDINGKDTADVNEDQDKVTHGALFGVVTSEAEIQKAFEEVLEAPDTLFPEGTTVDEVCLDEGDLLIGFSKEFMNYGGTMWEEGLVGSILDTAFFFQGVESVTVHVAEKLQIFVEGSSINGYTREKWEERKVDGDDEVGW